MTVREWTWLGLAAVVPGCACRSEVEPGDAARGHATTAVTPRCDARTALPNVTRSPGGTPEVSASALAAAQCKLRVIDVRSRAELAALGVIAGSEHIPLEHLANRATGWAHDEPIVIVCRSGRRSGVAARELAQLGFDHVSSLTGGVLAWSESGHELVPYIPHREIQSPTARKQVLTVEDVQAHVADHDRVRMTKAASLLLQGTQACVDGRDARGIVGTPGGDAGELVLALAAAEQLGRTAFTPDEIARVFADYLDAFGHFYLHTDVDAAERWLDAAGLAFEDHVDAEDLLRAPPQESRARLLDTVADPEHVGCGHLRLSLQHPQEYGVRPGLVRDVMSAYFRRLWAGDTRLEFVVLEGDHAESGTVRIEMERRVYAYSEIPLVSPRVGDTEVFVLHPHVSAFIREQNTAFLLEDVPSLVASGVQEDAFLETLETLAQQQLAATIGYLAPDLPLFVMKVRDGQFSVEAASDGSPNPQPTAEEIQP